MADKEHTRANRSDYFANRLVGQIDLIAVKDLLAKPDLKSSWFFTRTPLAD
jgi:hypothetical protein